MSTKTPINISTFTSIGDTATSFPGYVGDPLPEAVRLEPALPPFPVQTGRKPHKCPVCNGTTKVPLGFYDHLFVTSGTSVKPEVEACRACLNGIIWEI